MKENINRRTLRAKTIGRQREREREKEKYNGGERKLLRKREGMGEKSRASRRKEAWTDARPKNQRPLQIMSQGRDGQSPLREVT